MRTAAIDAIGRLRPPLGAPDQAELKAALKSPQVEARRFAAAQFVRLGAAAAESRAVVFASANDRDFEVRRQVFACMAAYGADARDEAHVVLDTIKAIVASGLNPDGALELFRQAIQTMAKIGEPAKTVDVLAKGITSSDKQVQKEVLQSIAALGEHSRKLARPLCALLGDQDLVPTVTETPLKVRGPEVVRALSEIVDEGGSPVAELAAIKILGQMGPEAKGAYQALFRKTTRSKDKEIIEAAKKALKQTQ